MKPSEKRIKSELRRLRKLVEAGADPVDLRVAYAVEQAIRWVVEETVGWPGPFKDTLANAELLRQELAVKARG